MTELSAARGDDPEARALPERRAFRKALAQHIQGCQDAVAALEGLSGKVPSRQLRNSSRRGGPLDRVMWAINHHPFLQALTIESLALGPVAARVDHDRAAAYQELSDAYEAIVRCIQPGTDGGLDIVADLDRVDIDLLRIRLTRAGEALSRVDVAAGGEAGGFARRVGPTQPQPIKVTHVDPVYDGVPHIGRSRKFVTVELTIGMDGSVTQAEVLLSVPPYDQAALEAVRQWKFEPPRFNGLPTAVVTVVGVYCPAQ